MPRDPEAADDDAAEALTDKLRSGDYGEVIQTAQSAAEAQLCLRPGGGVKKADPHTAFAGLAAAQAAAGAEEDPESELRRLRQARMAQLKDEHAWRRQGHGSLRELADEREFVEVIQPHERAVAMLDDGRPGAAEDVRAALGRLAQAHLETQFCRLHVDKAVFLTHMVELEGLPALFVLRDGQVTRHLSPERLFEFSSASSPLFVKHLARLLHRVDALSSAEAGSGSEAEEDEEERGRRRR